MLLFTLVGYILLHTKQFINCFLSSNKIKSIQGIFEFQTSWKLRPPTNKVRLLDTDNDGN